MSCALFSTVLLHGFFSGRGLGCKEGGRPDGLIMEEANTLSFAVALWVLYVNSCYTEPRQTKRER
jgi:hypothetical protein